ncbi:MAG: NmrA family NAD(P)-binding protein [Chloroflexota bacterium]
MKPKILVTAAKGNTGLSTAQQLVHDGYPVRLFVRSENEAIRQLKQKGAELFIGDMTRREDWPRALADVQRVFYCSPMSVPDVIGPINLFLEAAQNASVEYAVFLGQWLAEWPDHPSAATQATRKAYDLFAAAPFGVTHLTPGWFASNYFFALESITQLGLLALPFGNGLCNAPSNLDMGRASAALLKYPAGHEGKRYRPTGPESLTPSQVAERFSRVLNRNIRYMNIPEQMSFKAIRAMGFSIEALSQLRYYLADYRAGNFDGATDVVEMLTGRPSEALEATIQRQIVQSPLRQRTAQSRLTAVSNFLKVAVTSAPSLKKLVQINQQIAKLNGV